MAHIPINRVSVEPAIEPVSVAEVKEAAFIVGDNSYDTYIKTQLIPAARRYVEQLAKRSLITQTRIQYYDDLDSVMYLRYGPVQSISSVTYKDSTATQQTLTASLYTLDAQSIPARLVEAYNQTYPSAICDTNSVAVTMVSGYGLTAASVPIIYRRAIILWASLELHNRVPIACAAEYMASLGALQSMIAIEGATLEYA